MADPRPADRRDWVRTLREALPRLPRVLRSLRPTFHVRSVAALDAAFLRAQGIRGVIWDVDGTLTARHGMALAREVEPAFRALLASPGLRHVVLSNAGETRFRELGEIFPQVPVVLAYGSPDGTLRRRLLAGRESWSGGAAPGPGVRALRKPNPAPVEAALLELGCETRGEVVLVGDQYLTDVAAANLAGVHSIKVATFARESFPPAVRLMQRAESVLYRLLRHALDPRAGRTPAASAPAPHGSRS